MTDTETDRRDSYAVVSGAGSGIGRALALALGRRGHRVALLGRRVEPLVEVRKALEEAGGSGSVHPVDVRDPQAVARAAAEILEAGPVEVLVPAAGTAAIAPLDETSPETFAALVDTNLAGAFHLIHAFLPALEARGRGRILPILSVAARQAFPGWGAYCASKWGLAGLVAALRQDLAGTGVLVTALYPGATDTAIWEGMPGTWDRESMVPVEEVARALDYALDADPRALVEEIHLGPAGGAL